MVRVCGLACPLSGPRPGDLPGIWVLVNVSRYLRQKGYRGASCCMLPDLELWPAGRQGGLHRSSCRLGADSGKAYYLPYSMLEMEPSPG